METLRCYNSFFLEALSDGRSEEDKNMVVNQLYKRFEEQVTAAPDDHSFDHVIAYLTIEKIDT